MENPLLYPRLRISRKLGWAVELELKARHTNMGYTHYKWDLNCCTKLPPLIFYVTFSIFHKLEAILKRPFHCPIKYVAFLAFCNFFFVMIFQ